MLRVLVCSCSAYLPYDESGGASQASGSRDSCMRMRMGFGPDGQAAVNPESDGADLDSSESWSQSPLICVNSVPRAIVGSSVPAC